MRKWRRGKDELMHNPNEGLAPSQGSAGGCSTAPVEKCSPWLVNQCLVCCGVGLWDSPSDPVHGMSG